MSDPFVGIDTGTTGCKSIVLDLDGNVLGQDCREYPCIYPGPGLVEQRYEDIILPLTGSYWETVATSGVSPEEIRAAVFSPRAPLLALVNAEGNLICDFLSWQGLWGIPYIPKLREAYGVKHFYLETGDSFGVDSAASKRARLRGDEPENRARTEWFLSEQKFLLKEWGAGGYWTDLSSASREGMLDVDSMQWSRGIHDLIDVLVEKCARPVTSPGKVVRGIGKDAACRTGLAESTLLCLGAHDQNCSALGEGAVRGDDCVMVMGILGFYYVVMGEPSRDPTRKLVVKPNHGMGNWTIEAFSDTSASSLRWYQDTLCREGCTAGEMAGVDLYGIITSQVRGSPAGANGVTFLPYLAGASGARQNPQVRTNISSTVLVTTKNDVACAVPEGICFGMHDVLDVQAAAGVEAGTIRLMDDVAKSVLWSQILADILQWSIGTPRTSEAGHLRAAVYIGVGAGLYLSCEEAAVRAVAVVGRFDPDSAVGVVYDQAFKRSMDLYESPGTSVF